MLAEIEPVHYHAVLEYSLQILAAKAEPFSIESFRAYVESEADLVTKTDMLKALKPLYLFSGVNSVLSLVSLSATVLGFSWLRDELAPLKLDVIERATDDATLNLAYDADDLTLTLDVPGVVKPSEKEFYVTCENDIVNVVW